jgi:hypothetical protein
MVCNDFSGDLRNRKLPDSDRREQKTALEYMSQTQRFASRKLRDMQLATLLMMLRIDVFAEGSEDKRQRVMGAWLGSLKSDDFVHMQKALNETEVSPNASVAFLSVWQVMDKVEINPGQALNVDGSKLGDFLNQQFIVEVDSIIRQSQLFTQNG